MNQDEAVALLRSSGLADRIERILPHLAPSLRIRTWREPAADRALVSRFGGCGVLPRGSAWPEWDSSALHSRWQAYTRELAEVPGASVRFLAREVARYEELARDNPKPIDFLAMVRLADVAPYGSLLGLPELGALLFFYDVQRMQGSFWPEARGGWRVLFVDDEADLELAPRPTPLVEEPIPSTLSFELQYTLPEDLRAQTGDDDLSIYVSAELARVHGLLLGGTERRVVHQLGGAPQEVQGGLMRQCQLASNGVDCGRPEDGRTPRALELASGAKDWRLLLQIDSDEEGPGWVWGDLGRLYYCLHEEDWAARRFDRTWCVEQCS